jgi:hypothetical protein
MERPIIIATTVCCVFMSCATENPQEPPIGAIGEPVAAKAPPASPMVPRTPLQLGSAPEDASSIQRQALYWVNTFRARAGLSPLNQEYSLNAASTAHAVFILQNGDLYLEQGLSVHEQDPDRPGFLGTRFWDRFEATGYNGTPFREVIAYHAQASTAVAHWMETVYHRLPIIHPNAQHIGYGEAHLENDRVNVLDIGAGNGWAPAIPGGVVWPPDGATQVPLSWDGLESPQPPVPPGGFPSGPVVTLTFPSGTDFAIAEHRLTDTVDGNEIPHVFITPATDANLADESSVALYAHSALQPARTYSVHMKGVVDGAIFERQWSFTTRPVSECSISWQDCGVGKGCYATADSGAVCAWAGSRRLGEPCEYQNDCEGGLTCISHVCRSYCMIDGGTEACDAVCPGGWSALNVPGGHGACKL